MINNGGCSHHCVVGSDNNKPKCLCPDNWFLGKDGKTCGPTKDVECMLAYLI